MTEIKVWRAATGYKHDPEDTIADIIRYETEELGNDIGVCPDVMPFLEDIPAKDAIWVTFERKVAERYGETEQLNLPSCSKIIGEDGEGGFLMVKECHSDLVEYMESAIKEKEKQGHELTILENGT